MTLGPRLPELQRLANSAGLTRDVGQMLRIQAWLLGQLRILKEEITATEKTLLEALAAWPEQTREVLQSLPHMSAVRTAVLLFTIGDVNTFGSDRQLRKHLGWHPEAVESGTGVYRHRLGQKGTGLDPQFRWPVRSRLHVAQNLQGDVGAGSSCARCPITGITDHRGEHRPLSEASAWIGLFIIRKCVTESMLTFACFQSANSYR